MDNGHEDADEVLTCFTSSPLHHVLLLPHINSQSMVLGRAGMRLEAQKFALYLMVPITASLIFNEPAVQKTAADYFQFMKYPSNPKTNLKEEFESMTREREEEIEWEKRMAEKREKGREQYVNQLKQLSSSSSVLHTDTAELNGKRGWLEWLRAWKRKSNGNEKDSLDA